MCGLSLFIIITYYYIILILHVFQHIYFYRSFFYIHFLKLNSYFVRYTYNTITILELTKYFSTKARKFPISSHIKEMINFQSLPEALQHVDTAAKNPKDYYHISSKGQGYDSFSFNKDNFQKILTEKDIGLMTFYEKKSLTGNVSTYSKIPSIVEKYSFSNMKGVTGNLGARPCSVDQLEFATLRPNEHNILQNTLNKLDLSEFKQISVTIADHSDFYFKVVPHPTKPGLTHGTILNDSALEGLEWLYTYLENNEEMCSYMNDLLEKNPFFPLDPPVDLLLL